MNLNQLAYLVAVVDEGSFTKAARKLLIAQPSLSHQIRALETELGGPLLERMPRAIRLTPAGKVFLPEARAALRSAERARRVARMANDMQAGELEIATVLSISIGILPRSIKTWHERHPEIILRLHEHRHRGLLEEQVRGGLSDVAIGPRPAEWTGPLESLGWEEFVVVLPASDPLLRDDGRLPLACLADRGWVLPDPAATLSLLVAAACADAGFQPRAAVHTAQVEAAARLAAAGLGPTMLPVNVIPPDLEPCTRRLRRPIVRELAAFTRTQWSPLAEEFVDVLRRNSLPPKPRGAFAF